jgi:hypothetical protein
MLVRGTERVLEARGVGSSRVSERYSLHDGLFVLLSQREQTSSGLMAGWGDTIYRMEGRHHVAVFVTPIVSDFSADEWTFVEGASPRCSRGLDDEGFGFAAASYYASLGSFVDRGRSLKRESLAGHETEVLGFVYGDGEARVWLDARSLFPLRYQYPVLRDGRGDELQPARLITITEFNPERPISPPGIACED